MRFIRSLTVALGLLLIGWSATAQFNGCPGGFCSPRGAAAPTWQQTWAIALPSEAGIGAGFSIRNIIPAADISLSGTTIRVTFKAPSGSSTIVDHASIVERSGSTVNGTTAPTELLFSGGSGFTVTAGTTVTSDGLSFSLDETKDYLVIIDLNGGSPGVTFTSTSANSYIKAGAASYNVQSPAGFSTDPDLYSSLKIEVFQ